jgi:hypothetical protein
MNSGATPASKVIRLTQSAILPVPLTKDFVFPAAKEPPSGEGMIQPQQNRGIGAIVEDYCDESEVADIKRANGKGLYRWGIVTYEDAFRNPRRTEFCQILIFLPDGRICGYYVPDRNKVT